MNTDENEQPEPEPEPEPEQAVATDEQHDEQRDKGEASTPVSVPRDEFCICDSPGSVCDENGYFPPCAE